MKETLELYDITASEKAMILQSQEYLIAEPVPIIDLAKKLGIKQVLKASFDEEISGMIKHKKDDGFVIITNKGEPKARRRFTIAHELAHFLLHRSQIGDALADNVLYRSRLSNQCEVEANRLAADILMPLEKIDEYIDKVGTYNVIVQDLAETFGVSVSAMKMRLGIPQYTT